MLNIGATSTDNLRPQVETRDRLKTDWDALLGPFGALAFWIFGFWFSFAAFEAALINKLGKLLLNQLIDLGDGSLQNLLCSGCNVKIQRGFLEN